MSHFYEPIPTTLVAALRGQRPEFRPCEARAAPRGDAEAQASRPPPHCG